MKLKQLLATLALTLGLTTTAFGDILTEQPYYWYTYDVSYDQQCGSAYLATGGNTGNVNINTASPWGKALTLTANKAGPWGNKNWAMGSGDWTLHIRAKMPSNLDKGVVISLGACGSAGGFMLLTRGEDAGVYLANTTSKSAINSLAISKSGLSSEYHDYTMVFIKSTLQVQLYIDGEAVSEGAFTLSKQITDGNWQLFQAHGGNNAVKYGYGVYIEEMRFYQKAWGAADIASLYTGAYAGAVALTEDTDWSAGIPSDKVRTTIDMNGHSLKIPNMSVGEVYSIKNSTSGDAAQLEIASGTSDTAYLGHVMSANIDVSIDRGTLKVGGLASTVTCGANATLDENGISESKYKVVMKNGATLTNTGSGLGNTKIQFGGGIELEEGATAYLTPSAEMAFVAPNFGKYSLNLNGGTLVKRGNGKWSVVNANISGAGKFVVEKGELNIGYKGFACDDGTVFELKKDSSAYIWVQGSCSVPTILGNGYIASSSNPLTVTKRYSGLLSLGKNGSSYPFSASKKLTLSGGATLDLNDNTDVYAPQDYFAFGDGEITIDVSDRDLTIGTQLVAWNSVQKKPSNTTFVWDATTAAKGVALVANDTGIYYGKVVVDATWTNALGDGDVTKPDNWTCYDDEGNIISGGVPADTTNLTIGDGKAIAYPAGTTRTGSLTLGTGATLAIDMSAVKYIEGTMLIASEGGLSIANGSVTTTEGGTVELMSDSKALLYLPSKTVVARWDFNEYDSEAPLSTNVLKATTGEAGFPCHYPGAGSTNITDGTIGGMSVVNPGLETGNYAIAIPKYYHVKLPLPKTVQHSDWTIRMRFYTPSEADKQWRTLFSRDNTGEGDIFINKSNLIGGGGKLTPSGKYYGSAIASEVWHVFTASQRNGFGAVCVDGEQSYTWTDNGKWNFFTDKDYLYLSADNSGDDGLLYIDYIELAVETPAHDSAAIVDGVLTSDVVLTNDQDWTSLTISDMNSKTIDLAGHTLTIASTSGTGKIYDSTTDTAHPGVLVMNVPEGETYTNTGLYLKDNLRLVKEGAGTYIGAVKSQTYTGGTVIQEGTIKSNGNENNYYLGANGTDITIEPNGTLDLNGCFYWTKHTLILNGGTIGNSGSYMYQDTDCIGSLRLTADSKMVIKGHVGFKQADGGADVDLGGHTLTVEYVENTGDPKVSLYLRQTTIRNGTLVVGEHVFLIPYYTTCFDATLNIVVNGDLYLSQNSGTHTIASLTDNSYGQVSQVGGTMMVTNVFVPASSYLHNTVLANGATLDLTDKNGVWSTASAISGQNVTFASEATIMVDVNGRTFSKGDQIVAWSAKPDGVTFQWDATTAEAGVNPSVDDFGIFYGGYRFTVDINNGGTFTIPNSVSDADLDSVRLFYAGGKAVSNPVRNGRTITYDWEITDKTCWWDYEFNGNVTSTGTDTTTMTAEGTKPYFNTNGVANTALWVGHSTHYRSATYPDEFTAVMYGKIVDHATHIQISFGSDYYSDISVTLACGDPAANEVRLLVAQGKTIKKTVSMSVPNAYTADHLYAFVCKTVTENETDKTKVIVYLDGIEWDSYTFSGKITLGGGFQIGSIYGGLSGLSESYSKADTSNENSFLDFLRTYAVAFNSEAMAAYAAKYPYKSTNGNASRTFASSEDTWTADNAWSVTPYEGEAYTTNIPPASALLTINATADATVTMNLDEAATYEQLKVTSGNAITLKNGGTVMPTVSGLTSVGADLTVDCDAIGIGKVMVAAGKTLTFDFDGFDISGYFTTSSYEVTGAVTLGADAKIAAINLPSSTTGRTVTFGLNEYGHYALIVTVDTTVPFVYTIAEGGEGAWTWGEQTVDEAIVLAQSAATITKAGDGTQQFVGLSKFNYVVDAGTLKFTNNVNLVSSTITVNTDGTFDMNGAKDASYKFVLNGGALVNNGGEIGNTVRQFDTLTLTANSTIGGTGNFAFIRNHHDAGTVDLGGWTLTKTGSNTFTLDDDIVTNGTLVVNAGTLQMGYTGGITFTDATLSIGAEGTISILEKLTLTVAEITGTSGATIANAGTLSACTLKGTITLSGNGTWNTPTLDGATVKLAQELRNMTFTGNGTVDVVLTDDEIAARGSAITVFTKAEGAGEIAIGTVYNGKGDDITSSCAISGGTVTVKKHSFMIFVK